MYSHQSVHEVHAMATLKDPPPLQPVRCWEEIQTTDEKRNATRFDRRWETTNSEDPEERKEYRLRKAAEVRGWTWGLCRNSCFVQSVL